MERKFYTNEFEELLKENADQFKMSPSKKVWHGIYNDIHPGTRWPSVAMGLLFVFTLILVGYLNIQQHQHSYLANVLKKTGMQKNKNLFAPGKSINSAPQIKTLLKDQDSYSRNQQVKERINGVANQNGLNQNVSSSSANISGNSDQKYIDLSLALSTDRFANGKKIKSFDKEVINTPTISQNTDRRANDNIADQKVIHTPVSETMDRGNITTQESIPLNIGNLPGATVTPVLNEINNDPAKNNIAVKNELQANNLNKIAVFTHKKMHRNSKINWAYYLSPGISYRKYSKQGNPADQLLVGYINSSNSSGLNSAVTHLASIGLEAGSVMKYSLSKKLKFTSGFQVNYSAYTIQANNIHPIIATLILHNERTGIAYPTTAISYFGNGPGNVPVNLHNYSVQFSVPVGLEYQLAGNDRVQFSAAGSFQPAFVVANKAYILSTDKRNYLTNPSLERNLNMGTNIGAFISFNSTKFNWQIGPQVHYQLLSSFRNEYEVREHFIDYSIRFAISRKVK